MVFLARQGGGTLDVEGTTYRILPASRSDKLMNEQQADSDTDDTEPTPGPAWAEGTHVIASPKDGRPNGEVILGPRSYGNDIPADEQRANARLCAAAFTAASELPDEYDPLAAVEALPLLITALEMMSRAGTFSKEGLIMAQDHARDVLNAVRKDTTQTDE